MRLEGEGDKRGWDDGFGWTPAVGDGQGGQEPLVLWFMGSQTVGHDWATELKLMSLEAYYDYRRPFRGILNPLI